jgi:hypothetical protein
MTDSAVTGSSASDRRDDSGGRHPITLAVRDYGDGVVAFAEGIDEQLTTVHAVWAGPELGDRACTWREPVPVRHRGDVETSWPPLGSVISARTTWWCCSYQARAADASNRHYLMLPASDPDRLLATTYPTIDLITAALDSRARDVLVIVNSCYCGQLDEDLARLRKDLPRPRQDLATVGVFTSADHDQRPRVREFAELLRRVTQELWPPADTAPFNNSS